MCTCACLSPRAEIKDVVDIIRNSPEMCFIRIESININLIIIFD